MRFASLSLAVLPHVVGALLLAAHAATPMEKDVRVVHADPSVPTTTLDRARPVTVSAVAPADSAGEPRPRTLRLMLEHGETVPQGRPNTWVRVPTAFDPSGELHLVFIFHGFKNCIDSYTGRGAPCVTGGEERPGYDIATQLERGGAKAIVVVPETSFNVPSAEAPALSLHGRFRAYVNEVLAALGGVTGQKQLADVVRLALVASSGGYQALEPILDGAMSFVTDVLLLDAGYMYPNSTVGRFMAAAARELGEGVPVHRVGLLYTPSGGALENSEALLRYAEDRLHASGALGRARLGRVRGAPSFDDLAAPFYVLRVHEDHDVVVRHNLGRVIAAAGL